MADWISNGEDLYDIRVKLNSFHSEFIIIKN